MTSQMKRIKVIHKRKKSPCCSREILDHISSKRGQMWEGRLPPSDQPNDSIFLLYPTKLRMSACYMHNQTFLLPHQNHEPKNTYRRNKRNLQYGNENEIQKGHVLDQFSYTILYPKMMYLSNITLFFYIFTDNLLNNVCFYVFFIV